jgi:hypothetical protein
MKKKEDTYSYKGWLISDKFIKRCFAVLGHYMVAGLLIYAVIIVFGLFLFLLGWMLSVVL